jgi:FG-GAP repeat
MSKFPIRNLHILPVVMLACSLLPTPTQAQFSQQGPKLVGTGAVFVAEQGTSASLSADGNTAIVGGFDDDNGVGAAWVYTRSAGVWSQQGQKLVATDAIGPYGAAQGASVALSSDGNTAIVGGWADNNLAGAAWVYTRSAGVWSQQAKLVGTGAVGPFGAQQGYSVSLSSDGNTAIVGGPLDDTNAGAAWVFTRSGGVWTQQGVKLVGTGAIGPYGNGAEQGWSVSLSGDGNTAIVGGLIDNDFAGAAWVFTRSGGVWSQQGAKLVGTGAVGAAAQGSSVSLSGDGNTAIAGGYLDGAGPGAAWVYTRSGAVWSQQTKLVGTAAVGPFDPYGQGVSVSLSGDGNIAIVGGNGDNGSAGAAWVYTRSSGVWSQQGAKLVGAGAVGSAYQGSSVALSADGTTAMVGGYGDNGFAGAAWVYTEPRFVGTPGHANCYGQSVSALVQQYGGLNGAAAALGFPSVSALQVGILAFCGE